MRINVPGLLITTLFLVGTSAHAQMFMPMNPFEGEILHVGLLVRPIDEEDLGLLSDALGTDAAVAPDEDGRRIVTSSRQFPVASSELADDGFGPYSAGQARDSERDTAWSEGVAGPGIGEWIAIESPFPGTHLTIFAGWGGREETWLRNNRLQVAYIRIYGINRTREGDSVRYSIAPEVVAGTITFDDAYEWQNVRGIRQFTSFEQRYIVILQIRSVYPGSRYDDTPIAEFYVDMIQ